MVQQISVRLFVVRFLCGGFLSLGAAGALISPVQSAERCTPVSDERFKVTIQTEVPDYKIDHSRNRAQMGWMALHGMTDDILGLHAHGIKVRYDASFTTEPFADGFCFWVREIEIVLRYVTPEIFIAREYEKDSCNYKALLKHELQHKDVAARILEANAPRFRKLFTPLTIPSQSPGVCEF